MLHASDIDTLVFQAAAMGEAQGIIINQTDKSAPTTGGLICLYINLFVWNYSPHTPGIPLMQKAFLSEKHH